jgi:hypothetical protein
MDLDEQMGLIKVTSGGALTLRFPLLLVNSAPIPRSNWPSDNPLFLSPFDIAGSGRIALINVTLATPYTSNISAQLAALPPSIAPTMGTHPGIDATFAALDRMQHLHPAMHVADGHMLASEGASQSQLINSSNAMYQAVPLFVDRQDGGTGSGSWGWGVSKGGCGVKGCRVGV